MEFKQAMRVIKRICATRDDCEKCALESNCPSVTVPSDIDYDKAETILAKWAAEHPEKTIMDDFFAKHPKALRRSPDYPEACARVVGYISECPATVNNCVGCNDCWRRPLEEVE